MEKRYFSWFNLL